MEESEEKSELQPFMLAGFGARCLAKLSHCFLVLIVATWVEKVEVLIVCFLLRLNIQRGGTMDLKTGFFTWSGNGLLGGGCRYFDFLFSPLLGEMIQFDEHIFQMG